MPIISMANPLGEFVSKAEPFFLYDHLESPQGPIIRIEQEQCNCRQLGCSIPSVGTVNHHRRPVVFNLINWKEKNLVEMKNCTILTFEILPIRTAPERMHLICSSQCVDSIAESQCTSSTVGKQISVQRKERILN